MGARRDIIVVGASAGGVEALSTLAAGLPAHLPAAVVVVLHLPANGISVLPEILSRAGPVEAVQAQDGMRIERGRIYVAPPGYHVLLAPGYLRVTDGPKENGHRPAVDPLFRSAARAYRRRVVGVILSGTLDDGTVGLAAVKMMGGTAVVQSLEDALFSGMPKSAAERVDVDYVLPVAEIPALLARLAMTDLAGGERGEPMTDDHENLLSRGEPTIEDSKQDQEPGAPSVFTCPECHGTLFDVRDSRLVHFTCRVGHAYSIESLLAAQTDTLEAALWTAIRSLEEKQSLAERLAMRARNAGHEHAAARFREQARASAASSEIIRQALQQAILL